MKKPALLLFIACLLFTIYYFGLHKYLSFSELKAARDDLEIYTSKHYLFMILAFSSVYIISTAVSIPGASLLTLMSGALFGVFIGTLVVSFSSTVGATLAFLCSRYLLRDWVSSQFPERLEKIDEGVEREGAFYLFGIRLIPVFPFFVVNLLSGLTKLKTTTYMWVSMLGMLPATVVYVNAGTQLSELNSASGILSPQIIASFVALGLLPIISKKLLNFFKPKNTIPDTN